MSLTRINEEGLERRRAEVAKLKEEVRQHEALGQEKEGTLWKYLGPSLHASINANREKMDAILASPSVDPMTEYANLRLLYGAVNAWRDVLSVVEVQNVVESKRKRVEKILEEIKQAQVEQGL